MIIIHVTFIAVIIILVIIISSSILFIMNTIDIKYLNFFPKLLEKVGKQNKIMSLQEIRGYIYHKKKQFIQVKTLGRWHRFLL